MNQVNVRGRLTAEPEVHYTKDGDAVANFSLAIPDRTRNKDKDGNYPTDFVRIVCFGKMAEIIQNHCTKGTELLVFGRIKSGSYQNKDGNTVYTTEVHLDTFEFVSSPKKEDSSKKK